MQQWQQNIMPPAGELVRVGPKHVKQFKELWLNNKWPCAICGKPFTAKDVAVVDHSHENGIIRGCLHNTCNRVEGELLGFAKRVSPETSEAWLLDVCAQVSRGRTAGKRINLIAKWCHSGVGVNEYLLGLQNYLIWHQVRRTRMIHPNHKFPNEGGSNYKKHDKKSLWFKRRRRR